MLLRNLEFDMPIGITSIRGYLFLGLVPTKNAITAQVGRTWAYSGTSKCGLLWDLKKVS